MNIKDFSSWPDDRVPAWVLKSRERARQRREFYQPRTGQKCSCKKGIERDNCPNCEATGWVIDFAAIRNRH